MEISKNRDKGFGYLLRLYFGRDIGKVLVDLVYIIECVWLLCFFIQNFGGCEARVYEGNLVVVGI